jgi:hypothetical protein
MAFEKKDPSYLLGIGGRLFRVEDEDAEDEGKRGEGEGAGPRAGQEGEMASSRGESDAPGEKEGDDSVVLLGESVQVGGGSQGPAWIPSPV